MKDATGDRGEKVPCPDPRHGKSVRGEMDWNTGGWGEVVFTFRSSM